MKVLVVGNEMVPFYKKGGLGDVMGALPKALSSIGVETCAITPYYHEIGDKFNFEKEGEFDIKFGAGYESVGVHSTILPGTPVKVYFLENKKHLYFYNVRGRNKKIEQFAFFDLAVGKFINYLTAKHRWTPDVIHCNDWHTGLIPLILRQMKLEVPTLLTIHNLLYQGIGPLHILDLINLEEEKVDMGEGRPLGEVDFLGEGMLHSTFVSTVSPTYAKEIMQHQGDRHDVIYDYIRQREKEGLPDGGITGILNGIDYELWSPEKDNLIFHKYDISTWEDCKKDNREDLLRNMGLESRPTFCFVGRMAVQKGLDTLMKAVKHVAHLNINLIILGSGDKRIEKKIAKVALENPWIKTEFAYSEELAHKIYAGSDFIIIPSRYEPCGLIQMISMKYGTIPIASDTGGLHDSIRNFENGFLFKKGKSLSLKKAIEHALNALKDKEKYKKMAENAMKTDFSWDKSAVKYKKLYEDMIAYYAKSQNSNLKTTT